MDKIYLIDAVAYLFRSYHAIRHMSTSKGDSTNALYGFIRSVQNILKDFKPKHLAAVFDGPDNKKSRTEIYEKYKAHRTGMPEDLFPQFEHAMAYCEYMGIPKIELPGVEADDTIGAIAVWARKKGAKVYLCSNDKDLAQLVDDKVVMINTYKENKVMDRKAVKEHYGVFPEQIADYLALMGDASDNIPGVPGVGKKTAADLLTKYESIKCMLDDPNIIKNEKQKERILTNKKQLLISQKLATLHLDLKIPTTQDFYTMKTPDGAKLGTLYRKMEFFTLLKEIKTPELPLGDIEEDIKESAPIKKTGKKAPHGKYTIVDDEKALDDLVDKLKNFDEICLDTETTHIRPIEATLVGVGLGVKKGEAFYIPTNGELGKKTAIEKLKPLLENKNIDFYGHNIKYDLHVLMNEGIEVPSISFDTLLASYLLNPGTGRHSLDAAVLEHFNVAKTPTSDLIGTGKKQKSMLDVSIEKVGNYCCEDVDYTFQLKTVFEKALKQKGLEKVFYDIDLPLVWVLLRMERAGIYVDLEKLKAKSKLISEKLKTLKKSITKHAGKEFNLNSPKQLSDVLFTKIGLKPIGRKKATGYSTNAAVLEELKPKHAIIREILEYRTIEKLRSTYIDVLPTQISKQTKRIHCSFNQSITATGRLSAHDPNLQNIPIRTVEGKKVREAFVPEKRKTSFLSADYSQVELRILAHLSGDKQLIEAFEKGQDIHTSCASSIFEVPLNKVTADMRRKAKAVNFGIIYGQQAYGLSQSLGIDFAEAKHFISAYFEKHPKIQAFIEKCKEDAKKNGYAKSITGRIRPLPEIKSKNPHMRAAAERFAVNTPIQGTQSDIIKIAMIEIDKELKTWSNSYPMILQIHDELLFEVSDDHELKLKKLVKKIMENAYPLKVPLIVDVSIGKNWGECYN